MPVYKNPLLEEYVDCLHFILSIGLHKGYETEIDQSFIVYKLNDITDSFLCVLNQCSKLYEESNLRNYQSLLEEFIILGHTLGFQWEEIEQAYMDKNAVNHERQSTGY